MEISLDYMRGASSCFRVRFDVQGLNNKNTDPRIN